MVPEIRPDLGHRARLEIHTHAAVEAKLALGISGVVRSARELRQVDSAADELKNFLALPVETFNGAVLKSITRVEHHAELDHVTLQDSSGHKLLENVSATFKPGSLIGIVSSDRLQAQALVELPHARLRQYPDAKSRATVPVRWHVSSRPPSALAH